MNQSLIHIVKDVAKDFVFPDNLYCMCCGNIIDRSRTYSLCDHCMTSIHWNLSDPRVINIKPIKRFVDGIENESCSTIADHEKDFMSMIKCADYGIYERSIIFALKYDGHKYMAGIIAKIMKDRLYAEIDKEIDKKLFENTITDSSKFEIKRRPYRQQLLSRNWIMVPVPLHKKRLRERGYNHAKLIASSLSKELVRDGIDIPTFDILERTRETRPMKNLGPEERERNIRNSIRLKDSVNPKLIKKYFENDSDDAFNNGIGNTFNNSIGNSFDDRQINVILIDDFYTTGSTAKECARALREGGFTGDIVMLAFAAR